MEFKRIAAARALELVESGMRLGLGSGTTATYFIQMLGERLQRGELNGIAGVATSEATAATARAAGVPLVSLADYPDLDLAVDGADEVDPQLNLIKGLGKALLREKIVEIHARRFVVVIDQSKVVTRLGTIGPVPIEVTPFEVAVQVRWLNTLGCRAELWLQEDGTPYITDNHNYLVRCWFAGGIPDAYALARRLSDRPGIVESGLFLDMADQIIIAGNEGTREMLRSD